MVSKTRNQLISIEVTVGANPRKAKQVPCPAKGVTPLQEEKRFVRAALPEVTSATDTGDTCSDDQDIDMLRRCCVHHHLSIVHANGLSYRRGVVGEGVNCRSWLQHAWNCYVVFRISLWPSGGHARLTPTLTGDTDVTSSCNQRVRS